MPPRLFLLLLCMVLTGSAAAQMGSDAVPDLSQFAGAIAQSASGAPVAAPAGRALFDSGLPVPSVEPGRAARRIGAQLRAALEAKAGKNPAFAQLETGMPAVLSGVEAQLEKEGFKRRDLGVAMAFSFLMNYETATHTTVPDEPSRAAARTVARAIAMQWGPSAGRLADAQKEDIYESVIVSATLLSAFTQQFEKAGKTAEADSMRATAGQMFEKLLGTAPGQVSIAPDGRISGLGTASGAAAPGSSAPVEPDTPPARAPRGGSGRGTGLRGVWRADWVESEYGMGGLQIVARNVTLSFNDEGDFIPELPSGRSLSANDLRAIAAAAPKRGGRYEVAGDQVTLHYGSGTTEKATLHRSGGTVETITWRGKTLGPKIVPPDGTRLTRSYGTERITSTGLPSNSASVFVAGSTRISFSADGRFRYGTSVSMSGQQVSGISRRPETGGQYEIKDGALTLREDSGKTTTYFIWTESKDLSKIFLNNALYE